MPIIVDPSMGELSRAETLAHIMAELAWGGYSYREARANWEELSDRFEEIQEAIRDGTIDEITVPLDEVLKNKLN